MFKDNLVSLRRMKRLSQEQLAEKVGVSRQALAKWESGETMPDIERCRCLAEVFGVTMDDLVNYEQPENMALGVPPRGKYLFGIVTVGDKGQIVIPARARRLFDIQPGTHLVVLGDETMGIALAKTSDFLKLAEMVRQNMTD